MTSVVSFGCRQVSAKEVAKHPDIVRSGPLVWVSRHCLHSTRLRPRPLWRGPSLTNCDVRRSERSRCSCVFVRARSGVGGCGAGISAQSHTKLSTDADRELYDSGGMNDEAIRRAALVTLRRAICQHFPPGRELRAWLRWIQSPADEPRLLPSANNSPARLKQ
jgi:hypothetical protein